MTQPGDAPPLLFTAPTPEQERAALLAVCHRTDQLGWPRADTLRVLRELGLVPTPDPPARPNRGRFGVRA